MKNCRSIACALCLGLALASSPAAAQNDTPERTPWGTPRIEGTWDYRNLTPYERPPIFKDKAVLTAEEAAAFRHQTLALRDVDNRIPVKELDVEAAYNNAWFDWGSELTEDFRTSLVVDPPNGRLPELTAEATKAWQHQNTVRKPPVRDYFSFTADVTRFRPPGPESVGLSERCLVGFNAGPPLVPSAYNNNLRIVQTEDYILLVTEMIHDARVVSMGAREPLPEGLGQWSGDSHGRWDGETLVVETRGFTDKTPAMQLPADLSQVTEAGGVGTGGDLFLIERFTRTADDRLIYEFTVEAPNTFERPFTASLPMKASTERMFEYACHEGNYAMEGMLKGARLLEAEEATQASGGGL